MNPNDILAQQQALMNQAMQNAQHLAIGVLALYLALFLLGCWVIYMFYARLRGIEQEIIKFRIAYEFSHPPETLSKAPQESRGGRALRHGAETIGFSDGTPDPIEGLTVERRTRLRSA